MELAFSDGLLRIARTDQPPGLRLVGEVDQANTPAFAQALTSVIQNGGNVHVNLAGLEFINVEGLRLLVDTAAGLPASRQLVLEALPAHLARVMQLVGWDTTSGLAIGGDYR